MLLSVLRLSVHTFLVSIERRSNVSLKRRRSIVYILLSLEALAQTSMGQSSDFSSNNSKKV